MKKLLLILFLFPIIGFSQVQQDTVKLWKNGGVFSANFSQVSLTNWAAGGKVQLQEYLLLILLPIIKRIV